MSKMRQADYFPPLQPDFSAPGLEEEPFHTALQEGGHSGFLRRLEVARNCGCCGDDLGGQTGSAHDGEGGARRLNHSKDKARERQNL